MGVFVHMSAVPMRPDKSIGSQGTQVTGNCSHSVDSEKGT